MKEYLKNTALKIGHVMVQQAIINIVNYGVSSWIEKRKNKNIVSIGVDESSPFYPVFTQWLAKHGNFERSKKFIASTADVFNPRTKEREQKVIFYPGEGTHVIYYKGAQLKVIKETKREESSSVEGKTISVKTGYTIETHKENKDALINALKEAYQDYIGESGTGSSVYYTRWGSSFHNAKGATLRSWESVILPQETKELLQNEIESFFDSEGWFKTRGIPYRKGFLLHGPPGTGKTSIVKGLASKYNLDVYIINFSGAYFDESSLATLFNSVKPGSIILFEDIDGLFKKRKDEESGESNKELTSEEHPISFRSFINLLDGVMSPEGVLIFMTTNYIDDLDPALIRPGRADHRLYIGEATEKVIKDYYTHFYSFPQNSIHADEFSSMVSAHGPVTVSTLQSYLSLYKESPEEALLKENYTKFKEEFEKKKK